MALESFNIIVSGVGGQGTVLSIKLLAECALASGAAVRSAETIGMAQRGGGVLGHVRISPQGNDPVSHSPLIPLGQAQLLIGFEPVETLRAYRYCRQGAFVVTATEPLMPPTASLQRLSYDGKAQLEALEQEAVNGGISQLVCVENSTVMSSLGFDKALNVVLLGAALEVLNESGSPYASLLSHETMCDVIKALVKQRYVEPNLRALEMGRKLREQRG
ncbi:MAG: 2-oxoacid:acceptor oxidoreductase family protein [Coriobacteriia bacterium]|nr:2-oxoacid:acceptor oxidoreductase family protein [Coriobacteriia bacterium]